jgi:hypothetical protein
VRGFAQSDPLVRKSVIVYVLRDDVPRTLHDVQYAIDELSEDEVVEAVQLFAPLVACLTESEG